MNTNKIPIHTGTRTACKEVAVSRERFSFLCNVEYSANIIAQIPARKIQANNINKASSLSLATNKNTIKNAIKNIPNKKRI